MTKNLKLFSLGVLAAVALTACVKQIWQVKYAYGNNNYTASQTVVAGTDGRIYIAGVTQDLTNSSATHGVFVAAFDANGDQLWQQVMSAPAANYANLASGKVLALDTAGNLYLGWGNMDAKQVTIYKFDQQGTLLNSWLAADGDASILDNIKIGPGQNLYVSMDLGSKVRAYSSQGALLWQYSSADIASPTTNQLLTKLGKFDFETGGNILHAAVDRVTLFSPEGNVLAEKTAGDLGLTTISGLVSFANYVEVLGYDAQQVKLLRLDTLLNSLGSTVVGAEEGTAMLARSGENLCVAIAPWTLGGAVNQYHLFGFTQEGVQQFDTVVTRQYGSQWQLQKFSGNTNGCDVGEVASSPTAVTSRITHVSTAGKLADGIEIKNYGLGDFVLSGKDVIQVGIAGAYDGSFTDALLTKHTRY